MTEMHKIYIVFFGLVQSLAFHYVQVSCRKSLPLDVDASEINKRDNDLRCGGTYSISEGYRVFAINSRSRCHYSFLGSKSEKCTATIYCAGDIVLANPSTDEGCKTEYITISDGTEGLMSACGQFSFKSSPRFPRSKGKDIYVAYKGKSIQTKCIVFCLEDFKNNNGFKPAKPLTLNKNWNGFKMGKSCVCGKKSEQDGRIVGGIVAKKFEFPWIAAIVPSWRGSERNPFCGGTLVNDQYVISAAHCFDPPGELLPSDVQVVLHAHVMNKKRINGSIPSDDDPDFKEIPGWNLADETDQSENSIRVNVEKITNHPLLNNSNFDYDISLIKLKTKVKFRSSEVSPICLPSIDEDFVYDNGENMLVAGWGRHEEFARALSRVLQKLDIPFVNLTKCKQHANPTMRHLCAGYLEGERDACQGDSGGPLMYPLNSDGHQYMLSGIVSAGRGCARKEALGLYTDVQEIVQWAYYNMDGSVWCQR